MPLPKADLFFVHLFVFRFQRPAQETMAIFMQILGCLCTFLCMTSGLHLEHDVLSLDVNLESKGKLTDYSRKWYSSFM